MARKGLLAVLLHGLPARRAEARVGHGAAVGYFATINYANQPYDLVLLQRREEALPITLPMGNAPQFLATRRLADAANNLGGQTRDLSALQGQALCALAGIARPDAFFTMLRARGLTLARTLPLPDLVIPLATLRWLALFLFAAGSGMGVWVARRTWPRGGQRFAWPYGLSLGALSALLGAALVHWLF